MAFTRYQYVISVLMVVTGSFNTLSVKYADEQSVVSQDGLPRYFKHPFMQSLFMFFGEMLCLLIFKIAYLYYNSKGDGLVNNNSLTKGSRNFNPLILFIPATCDMLATSIMYVGLSMTYVSSFQMLRGAVIVFTGVLSVGFLDRKLGVREWTGIIFVIFGLAIVSISDIATVKDEAVDRNTLLTGDLLIVCAQIIVAVQMVVEEKFVVGQDIPALQAVGWEGVFGFIGICLAMIPLNFIHAPPPFTDNSRGTLEDTIDAFVQIKNSGHLLIAIFGMVLSIAFFNFTGISVTKEISATTRMVLDSIRTVVIWTFSLIFLKQSFHYLQLVGFLVLMIGIFCYNDVIIPSLIRKCWGRITQPKSSADEERIINIVADDVQETMSN